MSAIITDIDKSISCGGCELEQHCNRWISRNWGIPAPDDCPIKSIDGLIEAIREHANSQYQPMVSMKAVEEVIKEYCDGGE